MVNKWMKSNGSSLSTSEYRMLQNRASALGVPLVDYVIAYGVRERYSTGDLQDPFNNSAKLTGWTMEVGGRVLFLAHWKYKTYFKEAKALGVTITDYLKTKGFVSWRDRFAKPVTLWLREDGSPLFREDYVKLLREVPRDVEVCDYLASRGYVRYKDSKKRDV